ncbi:hypothetical protein GIB67_012704 [Kingdonia uniflora]|uniref:Uncharacterized protein n=1 Tax=Kingdonia uniflora TaxID=39325 RepID=A0A7J7NF70_9MAGN|nr:hypothetical protein GIB67_012704 [Kingdonia uniflora]
MRRSKLAPSAKPKVTLNINYPKDYWNDAWNVEFEELTKTKTLSMHNLRFYKILKVRPRILLNEGNSLRNVMNCKASCEYDKHMSHQDHVIHDQGHAGNIESWSLMFDLYSESFCLTQFVPEDVQALALHAVRGKEFPYKKRKTVKLAKYSSSIKGNGVKEVIFTLDPLIKVLRLVDGRGSTAGYLYEAMEKATVEFEQNRNSDPLKYSKLVKLYELKRDGHILHKIHAVAAFLNPSFMYDGKFTYEQTDVKDDMNYIVERMVHPSEWTILLQSSYFTMVAFRILSQPYSSIAYGTNWSAYDVAQTKKINEESDNILEDLIYTTLNTKIWLMILTLKSKIHVQ